LESTADGILVVDRNGRITALNKRFSTMWCLPDDFILNGLDRDALSAVADQVEDPDAFLDRVQELYEAPEAESFDLVWFRDGRVFERLSQPQRLGSEIVGRVWCFRDVTERERLLRRAIFLSDASRLLASLEVERALEGVAQLAVPYLGDECAIDLLAEKGGPRRLFSISRDSAKSISTVLPRAVLSGHALVYPSGLNSQMAVPLMARGDLLGVITFGAPSSRRYTEVDLALAEELARRVSLAIENVGLYRKSVEALDARDEFLSIAAHELRGPVTSLHFAVQSLAKGELPPAQTHRVLELVAREDRRLVRFVNELLDVARIRTGRLHFALEEVDLGEVAREVGGRMSSELGRSGSTLRLTTEAKVIGNWDRARVDQVVTNLLSNAIKFGLGKPIELSVTSDDGVAKLVIHDRGIGIPRDKQDHIFDPYERAVSTRHYGGIGLGLYIVRTILDGLGGSVSLESDPGVGTKITIELPKSRMP
ncbi:MAG: ATP-binding protein, partial [Polyangiaceae bacterium]